MTILIYCSALSMAAGEDAGITDATGDAGCVGVLEPGLGVLAASTQAVPETGERDLTFLPTRRLYLFQGRLCRLSGCEEAVGEPHGISTLEEQVRGGRCPCRGRLRSGPAQGFKKLFCLPLQLRWHLFGVRQAHPRFADPDLWLVFPGHLREQGVRRPGFEPRSGPGLGHGKLRAFRPLLRSPL